MPRPWTFTVPDFLGKVSATQGAVAPPFAREIRGTAKAAIRDRAVATVSRALQ
jgi:hypothetical protein